MEPAAPLQDGTISHLKSPLPISSRFRYMGIISLAPFSMTKSPSSLQSGDSEPDIPLDMHMGLYLHLIIY